jgi:glycosyltransferase involved in cell wall biosynthesis
VPERTGALRPRVAFDVTPLQNAHRFRGIGRYVRGLATALNAQQELAIEFWGWHDDRPFDVRPPHRGLWLRRFGLPRTRWSWFTAPIGMRIRRRLSRVEVAHITDPRAFSPLPIRTLTTVYDLIPLLDPDWNRNNGDWRAYTKYLDRLRGAAGIFAISNQTAIDLRQQLNIPPPAVQVAPPGVPQPAARPETAVDTAGSKYFLYVGSAERHKNLGVLLEAYSRVVDLPERLVMIGPWYGPNLAMLRGWLASHRELEGRVHYQGFVSDDELFHRIRGATAVVVPSRWEGFGLPAAEALAAGGVLIHSRIPVLLEVSGSAALAFDPASPDELAEGLRQLSSDAALRHRLREAGMARAGSLTWGPAVERTLAMYQSLLAD